MNYYNSVNMDVAGEIGPAVRSVCEFGCGAGALARVVKARNPGVHYVGVDLMADQLALAGDAVDLALCRNLDQLPDLAQDPALRSATPLGGFDHVVFGDVLEHLVDPQRALNQAAALLAPGGSAIICIPNVQHWSVFAQLVVGSWPRADSGLFDRTHLRWFALPDMVALVQSAGLVVEKVTGRIFPSDEARDVLEDLEPLARRFGVDPEQIIERGQVLQYVLVGRKPQGVAA